MCWNRVNSGVRSLSSSHDNICWLAIKGFIKVVGIYFEGDMKVWARFSGHPSNSKDISVRTKEVNWPTDGLSFTCSDVTVSQTIGGVNKLERKCVWCGDDIYIIMLSDLITEIPNWFGKSPAELFVIFCFSVHICSQWRWCSHFWVNASFQLCGLNNWNS